MSFLDLKERLAVNKRKRKEISMEKETKNEIGMQKVSKQDHRFKAGFLTGIIAVLLLIGVIWGGAHLISIVRGENFVSGSISKDDVEDKLDQIGTLISKYYLYADKIEGDVLADGIYSGYAEALGDPYTEYYDEEETKALLETTSGEISGIGAAISKNTNTNEITIVNVYDGSPADIAGVQKGDIVYAVDGKDVAGQELDTVASWMKGEKGTKVTLTVLRDGEKNEFCAVRDIIQIQTVEYEMKADKTGYIAVSEFDDVTYDQFKTALDDLETQGMEGLIIDLRGNPGGNLTTVTDMLKLILPEGTIVSTKDKYGNTEEITCDGSNKFTKPLVVLVNQYSASASEIFSGAVQDYGIGEIVGMTTYGKGVVQQIFFLGDGTSLKVTMAEYYTPSGRSINGEGIKPDVEVEYEYDEGDPLSDNQLERAMEEILYLKKNKNG